MFFKKRKRKEIKRVSIDSKFKSGEFVHFRHRDELYFGYVFNIYSGADGSVVYDIQVGGQCPAVIRGVKEEVMFIKK